MQPDAKKSPMYLVPQGGGPWQGPGGLQRFPLEKKFGRDPKFFAGAVEQLFEQPIPTQQLQLNLSDSIQYLAFLHLASPRIISAVVQFTHLP